MGSLVHHVVQGDVLFTRLAKSEHLEVGSRVVNIQEFGKPSSSIKLLDACCPPPGTVSSSTLNADIEASVGQRVTAGAARSCFSVQQGSIIFRP